MAMNEAGLHNLAGHIPGYVAGPGGDDVLFSGVTLFVILMTVGIGVLYFKLHALPESMAHHANHTQFQLVGILSLLALFTHNNIFWIAALLLAAARLPDFSGSLQSIADSLKDLTLVAKDASKPKAAKRSASASSRKVAPTVYQTQRRYRRRYGPDACTEAAAPAKRRLFDELPRVRRCLFLIYRCSPVPDFLYRLCAGALAKGSHCSPFGTVQNHDRLMLTVTVITIALLPPVQRM